MRRYFDEYRGLREVLGHRRAEGLSCGRARRAAAHAARTGLARVARSSRPAPRARALAVAPAPRPSADRRDPRFPGEPAPPFRAAPAVIRRTFDIRSDRRTSKRASRGPGPLAAATGRSRSAERWDFVAGPRPPGGASRPSSRTTAWTADDRMGRSAVGCRLGRSHDDLPPGTRAGAARARLCRLRLRPFRHGEPPGYAAA